jgi:hypothetical protein
MVLGERVVEQVAEGDLKVTEVDVEGSGQSGGPVVQLDGTLTITATLGDVRSEPGGGDQLFKVIRTVHDVASETSSPSAGSGVSSGLTTPVW